MTHDSGTLRGFHVEPVDELPADEREPWPINYDTRRDRYTATRVVAFLNTAGSEPFLAVADLHNPHNICGWVGHNQGEHVDAPLPPDTVLPPLPPNFEDDPAAFSRRPRPVQYVCCTHNRLAQTQGWTAERR